MRAAALLALFAVLAACSSQPTTPQAEPAPASVPASEVAAPTAEPAAAASEGAAAAKPAGKIPSGYRRETRNGKELYCRNVTTLGSRFPQKMCFTREQIEEIASRTDAAMDDMERSRKVCVGAGCGGF